MMETHSQGMVAQMSARKLPVGNVLVLRDKLLLVILFVEMEKEQGIKHQQEDVTMEIKIQQMDAATLVVLLKSIMLVQELQLFVPILVEVEYGINWHNKFVIMAKEYQILKDYLLKMDVMNKEIKQMCKITVCHKVDGNV